MFVITPFSQLSLFAKFLRICGMVGVVGTATGVVWGGLKFLGKAYGKVKGISDNIQLVVDNHIPHLQASLDSHGLALTGIRSELRDMGTHLTHQDEKLVSTNESLGDLHDKFIQHLENVNREVTAPVVRKRRKG